MRKRLTNPFIGDGTTSHRGIAVSIVKRADNSFVAGGNDAGEIGDGQSGYWSGDMGERW
jgi:hypothetical protein